MSGQPSQPGRSSAPAARHLTDSLPIIGHQHLRHEAGVLVSFDVDTDFVAAVTAAEPVAVRDHPNRSITTGMANPAPSSRATVRPPDTRQAIISPRTVLTKSVTATRQASQR